MLNTRKATSTTISESTTTNTRTRRKRLRQRIKKNILHKHDHQNTEVVLPPENVEKLKGVIKKNDITQNDCAKNISHPLGESSRKQVEIVQFKSHKPKNTKYTKAVLESDNSRLASTISAQPTDNRYTTATPSHWRTTNLNQLRHEVTLFGIKGFNKDDRQVRMEKLAIKLGAKPRKNEYTNYKDLIKQWKIDHTQKIEKRQVDKAMGLKVTKNAKKNQRSTRDINAVPIYGGTLGTYKDGAQIINKKYITKFHRKQRR